ncbi:MAG: nickel-dependent hydrogenase large subunit [Candidatus Nezhaarchaeota archaeon]|nr:nickel-dependent hydrogenase large subunit [Candidatus Nezhaarchaeota archaeon]MCX8141258.1 nickel-dependent hydrogenase large subunit [Candidatus Nezhaarchaeota archaeon]MDW8049524.1 nickel-dependent hydrogenase large subunit [Nitrososphaerota archaeon]
MSKLERGVMIPLGPYHPTFKEPELFKLYVDGEDIVDVDIRLGFMHRGVEYLAQKMTVQQVVFLVERICGICSTSHPISFCQAVEEAMGLEVPDRARYIRTLIGELERIHSHMLWAGVALHLIGYDTLFMYFWRYREPVCELFEELTGNRQHYAMLCPGGVRRDVDLKKMKPKILKVMKEVKEAMTRLADAVARDKLVKMRMEGVGVLTKQDAIKYCVVGPTARGSGLKIDVRVDEPYAAYKDLGVDVKVMSEGDVLARTLVRALETIESTEIVERCVDAMPNGPIKAEFDKYPIAEGIGKHEAPRGEVIHYVKLNGTPVPERVKIRAPTYANLPSLIPQLIGYSIADAPIIIGGIDPCFCCTERVSIVDVKEGKTMTLTMDKFNEFCRKRKNPLKVG